MNSASINSAHLPARLTDRLSTLGLGIAGSVLCWLAFPPVSWSWLAWIAPVPWLLLVRTETLPGRRPYWKLWLSGMVFWLLAVHWIRLPHPLNHLALLALAGYLGIYLSLFVALSRIGLHQLKIPLAIIAPVVWTGLDYIRAHFLTGFLMGSLAHTQYQSPRVIQIADLVGEYGVTFLIIFIAACVTEIISSSRKEKLIYGSSALALLAGTIVYGHQKQLDLALQTKSPVVQQRIALIQGNTLADWKSDPAKQQSIMDEYWKLSLDAVKTSRERDGRAVDLVVWPETAFRQTLWMAEEGNQPQSELVHESHFTAAQEILTELTKQLGCAVLVGIDRVEVAPGDEETLSYRGFNSSVLVDKFGETLAIYDKMHLVPFGEFIPFADWFPVLYQLTPLSGGAESGKRPVAMTVGEVVYSPNICYETVVPHLIRQQFEHLMEVEYVRPDILINLTNDAWYWGSSELDMHLACSVFRAVEMRTPVLITANGGLSAHVDDFGHIVALSLRQKPEFLLVDLDIPQDSTSLPVYPSFYASQGDWFAALCMVCCVVLAVVAAWNWFMDRGSNPRDASRRG
ncbi:apolipoprotein N-acyltransferase [Bythopirellula polymerisocia]|uniref:Apolipoprotein N-acyltransferase n=1 Tax=Bythopirellula polymerisocia TaxID=2528003 RepID=A0A5C6D282_9BACT|nr:apolipoprotein N-acyltransferase [Bythopirellula polymerisocia]TWU29891.1 Apolipoprotein N-acyltransferase [Bythopirellula polymerisocia]